MVNMNLLFCGPPGCGKSELARYIGERLAREIICKRVSDIQSMYVGEMLLAFDSSVSDFHDEIRCVNKLLLCPRNWK